MAFDDEIPSAPGTGGAALAVAIDDEIDASAFEGVGKLGEAMPKGTYHFRLDSFSDQISGEGEPYFSLTWKCQEEPYTGRTIPFDNVPWVKQADIAAAAAGDTAAKAKITSRLVRANSLMEAAGFKPTGKFGFKAFLSNNPEVKLTLSLEERKSKSGKTDGKGKPVYVGTGEMGNKVVRYLSLRRPS